jgi:hypothetical protein
MLSIIIILIKKNKFTEMEELMGGKQEIFDKCFE